MDNVTRYETAGQANVLGLSLEDATLLVDAHQALLADQAAGVQVLGSTDGRELLTSAYARLNVVDELDARRTASRRELAFTERSAA